MSRGASVIAVVLKRFVTYSLITPEKWMFNFITSFLIGKPAQDLNPLLHISNFIENV